MKKSQTNENKQEIEEIRKDLDNITDLDILASSKGGKVLVKGLMSDIVNSIDSLSIKYSKLTLQEFVSLGADIKTKLDIIRVVKRAKTNREYLEKLLEEAIVGGDMT